ncbi:MAG: hypothetical protein NZ522_03860, partial [Chitinophagales bacterium]|nr:hypothetical protein [Chitinophagales bacterium]
MQKILLCCVLLILAGSTAVAQNKEDKKEKVSSSQYEKKKKRGTDTETRKLNIKRYLKLGDRFYAESAYYTATEYYKEVVLAQPQNRYANYWLAMSLLMSRDYEKAELFFQKFAAIKPGEKDKESRWKEEDEKLFDKFHFYYAQALHRNGKYEEAIRQYSKFKATYDKEDKDKWVKLANNGIKGCELGLNPYNSKIKVNRLSTLINRSYNEISPVPFDDNTIYFSSLPSDTLIFDNKRKLRPEYRIYTASLTDGGWGKPVAIKNEEINTPRYNVGNGSFNADKTRFYFTKCTDMEDDRSLCNLFVADVKAGKFTNVQRLPEPINYKEKYTSTHPTVRTGTDGREIVYFVSDREGGKGGLDIWYTSRIKNGEYTAPKLVGGPINTPGDEVTPFWDEAGKTLYFSSNGHPGFGGFDVFASKELPDFGWEEPRNLGKILNTGYDELYYNVNSEHTRGFFTSNRPGGRALNGIASASDDIFTWEVFNFAVEGIAYKEGDADAGSLEGATFKLYRIAPDGSRELVAIDSNSRDGKYFFKLKPDEDYEVEAVRPGFKPTVEFVSTKDLPMEDTINKNIGVRKSAYVVFGEISEEGKPDVKLDDVVYSIVEVSSSGVQKNFGSGKTAVGQ